MVRLFWAIVEGGGGGEAFSVRVEKAEWDNEDGYLVKDLREAIKAQSRGTITDASGSLRLFLAKVNTNSSGWLKWAGLAAVRLDGDRRPRGFEEMEMNPTLAVNNSALFGEDFKPGQDEIHVLVVVPHQKGPVGSALLPQLQAGAQQYAFWYGTRGSIVSGEGINLEDPRTLSRSTLSAEIARRLEETHVLLVKSPPMTGKTSLATLVSRFLVEKHTVEEKKMVLFNLSALAIPEDSTFAYVFKKRCEIGWSEATVDLPAPDCTVYLVVDEVQVLYTEGTTSRRGKATAFWEQVKFVLSNAAYSFRILMFAAYGSGVEYARVGTPIEFDDKLSMSIDQLNFGHDEVSEYVRKWFEGFGSFDGWASALEEFNANLIELTGGHVGLTATAIDALNGVYRSRERSASAFPSAAEWIHMLRSGSLQQANDKKMFKKLTSTCAVAGLNTLNSNELDRLESIAYGSDPASDAAIVKQCLRMGVLVQTDGLLMFSSPMMWRLFVEMRVGRIDRSLHAPKTLPTMIARVIQSIDYSSVCRTLGTSLLSGIPLERVWQMEFYKAAYCCTPGTYKTSVDVGALFGSRGFIDFTIHGGDVFWGIELLREDSDLVEHIERFSPGGRYSSLELTDFCLIDFRRVASIDNVKMEQIAADLLLCDKLFLVCYDAQMVGVVVFTSAKDANHGRVVQRDVVYQIQQ